MDSKVLRLRNELKKAIVRVFPLVALSILAVAVGFLPASLNAQTFYGSIAGTVTDASGAVVPDATVTAMNIGTNEKHVAKTGASGEYRFVDLVPATYQVGVEAPSFKRFVQDSVPVLVDASIRVDAVLQVGSVTETVEVTTEPVMLQTDSGSISAQVEAKTVQGMPLNGRNAMNLLTLVPGVIAQGGTAGPVGGNSGNSHTQISGFGNYAIAGGIGNESGNYIDGAPVNMLGSNAVGLILTQDVVQEFKVSMNAVSAEFGRFGGGVVEMTSKSGSNQFHGTAYEYVRNTMLNALPFYTKFGLAPGTSPVAPPYHQNQYGGTIGGPVLKNRIFGFFGIENYQQHVTASGSGVVPTAIMRGQSTNYPNMAVFKNTTALPAGVKSAIVDQSTKGCPIVMNPMGPGTNTYGVPSTCWDASAQIMKQFYPLPNAPGVTQDSFAVNGQNNWIALSKVGNNTLNYTARGDANVRGKQRIFGRYSYWHIADIPTDNYAGTNLPFNHQFGQTRFFNHGITVGDTYTVNQNTVADLRLSWDRMTQLNYADKALNTNEAAFGPAYAAIASTESFHEQPTITFGNGNHVGYQLTVPFGANQTDVYENYTLNASLVRIMGNHTVKIGGESTLRNHSGIGNFAFYGGYFTYSPNETSALNPSTGGLVSGTGDEYASFMIGDYDNLTWQTQLNSFTIDWSHAVFVTDTWRVTNNLTLNLGARWEYPGGLYEKKDRAAVFLPNGNDPNAGASSPGGSPNPQHVPGTLALVNTAQSPGRGMSMTHKDLFGPRISFAERLRWNSVFRGGYGISYLPPDMSTGLVGFNSPVDGYQTNVSVAYSGGSQAAPGYFLSDPLPATPPPGYLQSFPNGLPQPPARTDPYPTHLYLGNALSVPVLDRRYPYMQQWNLAYSKEWKGSLVTDVAYMGSKGTHLPDAGVSVSGNNGVSGIGLDELNPQYFSMGYAALTANTTTCPTYNGTNTLTGKVLSIPVYRCLEQYPQFSNVINTASNGGSSHYNAVYVSVQKRFRSGGVINGNYTRSKAIDDTDQPGTGNNFQDFYNRAAEKSVSTFDIPNRLVVSYVLDLPFGKGRKWLNGDGLGNYIVGGWQLNSIVQMQSGGAYAFTYNNSSFLFSQGKGNAGISRPDILPGCNLKGTGGNVFQKLMAQGSGKAWFNSSCIVPPGVANPTVASVNSSGQLIMTYGGTANLLAFGDAPRSLSSIRGPINQNWDLALSKSTPVREGLNVMLRAEVFDLWNHPTFGNAGAQLTNNGNSFDFVNGANIANAGTGGMRLVQLSGRVTF